MQFVLLFFSIENVSRYKSLLSFVVVSRPLQARGIAQLVKFSPLVKN